MTGSLQDTDILIIGAGFAGAATAYHLAQSGCEDLLIAEQEGVPGVHSSGRNAAIVREHSDMLDLQSLVSAGAAELRRGRLARFERNGALLMGMGGEDASHYFPRARGRGQWCPDDGVVDVAGLLRTYLNGRRVLYDTRVLGWTRVRGGLCVHTTRGQLVCRIVVNAAGPWAGLLGQLPLTPMNRHLFVTTELPWVQGCWPTVWHGHEGLYFRPESGGLLFCGCDETPAAPGDYREDPRVLEELYKKLCRLQPDFAEISIQRTWVGQRTFGPDRRFVIGFDPRNAHVFHVAGLGGQGVTASFPLGRFAADLILGATSELADSLSPVRMRSATFPV